MNSERPGWTVWEAPRDEPVRGRLAFAAAELARREGRFDEFHWELLAARHQHRRRLDELETIAEAADRAGMGGDLEPRLRDTSLLDRLRTDHLEGEALGVFGTPTLVFPGGGAAYVRIRPAPEGEDALDAYDEISRIVAKRTYVLEVKRPR